MRLAFFESIVVPEFAPSVLLVPDERGMAPVAGCTEIDPVMPDTTPVDPVTAELANRASKHRWTS